ncbi:MAG TPA: hypothetical protein VL689_22270 [Paraburkholderia sp.]|jgi:hypothetical protein|nr:hypothetical protein [Paraburkholderia sp.]
MNEPRRKNATSGVAVFIVVVLLIVIGTLLFNAIRGKREYDEQMRSAGATAASKPAAGAAQQP